MLNFNVLFLLNLAFFVFPKIYESAPNKTLFFGILSLAYLTTRLRCGVLYRFMVGRPPFCVWYPLINRGKTGGGKAELFLKNPKNYFEGFLSGASRISRVWGRHSPTRFPQGQNERKANFGTSVESCSEKLPLSSAADFAAIYKGRCGCFRQYSDCSGSFCPLWFCFLLRTETENAKRIFTFFITTTVAPCRSAKSGAIFLGQTSPSPPTTTGMFGLPKIGAIKAANLFRLTACATYCGLLSLCLCVGIFVCCDF